MAACRSRNGQFCLTHSAQTITSPLSFVRTSRGGRQQLQLYIGVLMLYMTILYLGVLHVSYVSRHLHKGPLQNRTIVVQGRCERCIWESKTPVAKCVCCSTN